MGLKNVPESGGSLGKNSLGRRNDFLGLSSLAHPHVRCGVKMSCLVALVEREKGMEAGVEIFAWLPTSHHFPQYMASYSWVDI